MYFHSNYVSTSVSGDGDYYQAMFEAEQDTDDLDSPYVLIQRQFEDPDDNWCYIETHDVKYCGHFLLRRVDFTPQKLSIELVSLSSRHRFTKCSGRKVSPWGSIAQSVGGSEWLDFWILRRASGRRSGASSTWPGCAGRVGLCARAAAGDGFGG